MFALLFIQIMNNSGSKILSGGSPLCMLATGQTYSSIFWHCSRHFKYSLGRRSTISTNYIIRPYFCLYLTCRNVSVNSEYIPRVKSCVLKCSIESALRKEGQYSVDLYLQNRNKQSV